MKKGKPSSIFSATAITALGILIYLPLNESAAQADTLLTLKAGKAYYVDYLRTAGIVTIVAPPAENGWAIVDIMSGFENSVLRSKRNVALNLSMAVLIELRLDIPRSPQLTAVIDILNKLAANAYQYRIRPTTMEGGGGGQYLGYSMPASLSEGVKILRTTREEIVFEKQGVRAIVDSRGRLNLEY